MLDSLGVYFNPAEVFERRKRSASVLGGLARYFLSGAFLGLLLGLCLMALAPEARADFKIPFIYNMVTDYSFVTVLQISVLFGFSVLIGQIVWLSFVSITAKLLGGRGGFWQLVYLMSIPFPVYALSFIFVVVPLLGALVQLVVSLYYAFYLSYHAVRAVHPISSKRAIIAALSPVLLAIFFVALISVLYLFPANR